jgi:hypothetical protein
MSIVFTYESLKKSNVGQVLSKAQNSQKFHFNFFFNIAIKHMVFVTLINFMYIST